MVKVLRKQLTAQKIFERAAMHLAKQGKKAMIREFDGAITCMNCTEDGLRCAVGGLLPLSYYKKEREMGNVGGIGEIAIGLENIGIPVNRHKSLLVALQAIHDNEKVSRWAQKLRGLARRRDLVVPEWLKGAK